MIRRATHIPVVTDRTWGVLGWYVAVAALAVLFATSAALMSKLGGAA